MFALFQPRRRASLWPNRGSPQKHTQQSVAISRSSGQRSPPIANNFFVDMGPTRDGTGERDFIHVMDVAQAHLAALERSQSASGFQALNIGTGHSVTVRELVATFSKITGWPIATTIAPQRAGDLACFYADPKLAQTTLGWTAHHGLSAICADAWRWQVQNPMGHSGIQ